jgi:mRNA-degrading endonuclease YafQ of YafQ-DinJ toxin-antitoxin module
MRIIAKSTKFNKQLQKLTTKQQIHVFDAIEKFAKGIYDKKLKVHKLSPKIKDKWAFSVEYDSRIIYSIQKNKYIIYYLEQVGSHNKVY